VPREKYQRWTVVQHSGYGYARNPQFKEGLEVRQVSNVTTARKIERLGGVLFDSWEAADAYAEEEMYATVQGFGLIPAAPGSFASMVVDGLAVYIPAKVGVSA
jgi:hypothetical protein